MFVHIQNVGGENNTWRGHIITSSPCLFTKIYFDTISCVHFIPKTFTYMDSIVLSTQNITKHSLHVWLQRVVLVGRVQASLAAGADRYWL